MTNLFRRDLAVIAVLIALNAYIALDLFLTEYLSHMESIEGAYIGISRYIVEHGLGLDWFPLWYGGIPFQNSYPPLLHVLVAAVSLILGISPAHAHHVTGAAFYCIAPVLLYLLAKRLSGDWRLGAGAALLYSLMAPSALLSSSVRSWSGPLEPARFLSLINFGDGPHVASVALIPLAILAMHWALEGRNPFRLYLAALASAAVVLTNWLGAFALALAVASYLLSRAAAGRVSIPQTFRVAAIALLAYASVAPWIAPSTIARIQHNAQYVVGKYPLTAIHLLYLAIAAAITAALWLVLRRAHASLLVGFACFFTLFSSALVMAADYFELLLMPQPHRYHHEIDAGLSLAIACGAGFLLKRLHSRVVTAALIALLIATVIQTKQVRRRARVAVGPAHIESTVEYQVADWLRNNSGNGRVFALGSIQFWLNAFSDTPQIGGGFAQGIANDQIPIVHFGIPWTEGDGADTANWLKLYGAAAVIVAEPGSRDAYAHGWRDPGKFRGVLEEAYRNGSDVIYGVPRRSDSLAHVVPNDAIVRRAPINNADFEPVQALLRALDDPSASNAAMECATPGSCSIRGAVQQGQSIFVQITYHKGWTAEVNGDPRRIERDGLGFMVIDPQCSGPCEVRLRYDGGREMTILKGLALFSNGLGLVWGGLSLIRRRRHRFHAEKP